ncbi:MAG: hypothetical protein KAS16_08435 [Thermoplasmata archaeon]|nr:hypothetical protein [Thermoplasmata archaeon]
MGLTLEQFATIFMLTFALFLVVVGVFTTYFGSGKSRKIGAGLMIGGLVLGVVWVIISTWFMGEPMIPIDTEFVELIKQSILVIAAAAIGALAAIGIFLLSIMKS